MAYLKADKVLPAHLLLQVRRYVSKGLLYIPEVKEQRSGWGHISGARRQLDERNAQIIKAYNSGSPISEVAEAFYLSESSIRKIIARKE